MSHFVNCEDDSNYLYSKQSPPYMSPLYSAARKSACNSLTRIMQNKYISNKLLWKKHGLLFKFIHNFRNLLTKPTHGSGGSRLYQVCSLVSFRYNPHIRSISGLLIRHKLYSGMFLLIAASFTTIEEMITSSDYQ